MTCKVVVIGVDGGSWNIIEPMINKGMLGGFRRILETGCWGILKSTLPPVTGPAWVSFSTGSNPGKHGIFDFVYFEGDKLKFHTSRNIKTRTFYELLSINGKRSIIIGLPLSYPPPSNFDGIMVSDFLYPRKEIYPTSKNEYIRNYRPFADISKKDKKDELLSDILSTAKNRVEVAKKLFSDENWDFYYLHFQETDTVLHFFWKNILTETEDGKTAKEVFKILDNFLIWLTNNMDKNTVLLVVSDHGFKEYRYAVNLNIYLKKTGLLKTIPTTQSTGDESLRKHILENILNKKDDQTKILAVPQPIYKILTLPLLIKISKRISRFMFPGEILVNPEKIDYNHSVAFVPTTESMGIHINPKFERKDYIVDYLLKELIKLNLKGLNVFKYVLRREEVYSGPFVKLAPEIMLVPNDHFIITSSIRSNGSVYENYNWGWHDMNGIFLAFGKEIKKGFKVSAEIYDIAPTILHIFGLAIPDYMDGRVLKEIFREDSKPARKEIIYQETLPEDDKIRDRIKKLRKLGKL